MTKTAFIVSLTALVAAGQAWAGGMPSPTPQTTGSADPCLLGNAADPAACPGMIRVAPEVTVTSSHGNRATTATSGSSSAVILSAPQAAHPRSTNCPAPQPGTTVVCLGDWVPAPQTHVVQAPPQPVMVAPQAQPSFQVQTEQVVTMQPPPVSYTYVAQGMMPPVSCCQQQEVTLIPASFFMGAMSYGVGFPTDVSYGYGGGGYVFVGGGTRFSGVRERTTLTPPPRKHRNPPPKPCGCH